MKTIGSKKERLNPKRVETRATYVFESEQATSEDGERFNIAGF